MTTLLDTSADRAADDASPASVEQGGRRPIAWNDWTRILLASIARIVLLSLGGSLLWIAIPALFGWTATTVMSNSMAPRFFAGDVIVSMPATTTDLSIGRILLVDDPDHPGRLRMHRFVGVDDDGNLITKGDANVDRDSSHVSPDHVRGIAALRAPWVALPIVWAHEGRWPSLVAAAIGLGGLAAVATIDAPLRRRRDEDAPPPIRPRARRGSAVPRIRLGLGVTGVLAITTLVVATGAHSAFAATAGNTGSTLTTAADFACWPTAVPADSPYFYYRYDGTGATATDASGNARPGTLQTGATRVAGGCAANASPSMAFNGTATGQIVPAASAAIQGPYVFSIETWFKTTSTAGGKLVGFGASQSGSSGNYDRHVYLSPTGQVVFGVYPGAVKTIASAAGLNDGAWHQVIATFDGSALASSGTGMKLYVDGKLVASDATVLTAQTYTGYWRIGYDNTSGWGTTTPTSPYAFTGQMDNTAVYTQALTAAQVTAHYAVGH